jgi:uroporphyrinogen-III synthase
MKKVLFLGLDPSSYQAEGEIIHYPLIQIVPRSPLQADIQKAFRLFPSYSHIIFTSKSAVQIFFDILPSFCDSPSLIAEKKYLVVGQVTAKHLRLRGIEPFLIAKEETAEGVIAELQKEKSSQAYFLWPHSALSRPLISTFLQKEHIRFEECILYDTQIRQPATLMDLTSIDEIIFTSPSTVDAFSHVFGAFPADKTLTPIGLVTAAYLVKHLESA